jgi:hypothetical protein
VRRWVFNVVAAVSLVLCVGCAGLWVRSYWLLDRIERFSYTPEPVGARRTALRLDLASGGVAVTFRIDYNYTRMFSARGTSWSWDAEPNPRYPTPWWWGEPGRYWWRRGFGGPFIPGPRSWYVAISPKVRSGLFGSRVLAARVDHWPLVLFTSILPSTALAAYWRRHRRALHGLCLSCGYNLTGNTSGVCPECGRPSTAGV